VSGCTKKKKKGDLALTSKRSSYFVSLEKAGKSEIDKSKYGKKKGVSATLEKTPLDPERDRRMKKKKMHSPHWKEGLRLVQKKDKHIAEEKKYTRRE